MGTIYTIRVEAYTAVGPGPPSIPVQVKTQQGVPGQPTNFRILENGATSVSLAWDPPNHAGENIISYELYWNDTYGRLGRSEKHRSLNLTRQYVLESLYPNTLYYMWISAKSSKGEGAHTTPIKVTTAQYVPGAPPQMVKAFPETSTS